MWFELTYTFLGGLGLFFLGMKTLSESLQLVAGKIIRQVIRSLTTNRILAVGVGTLVTAIVQSSSVTTVMVVGFVNAGLLELTQAIGVIMGANIGTTLTGWILAVKVGKYGPLLLGVGIFPALFVTHEKSRAAGKVLVALGLIFMGLSAMSGAFKPLRTMEGFLTLLQYFAADDLVSLLACVAVGTVLTCIIQSSSAMLGITIALAATGTITFQTAVALVMGENIGTTITAILASVGTTTAAKRAARAHAIFNCMGVVWLVPFFWVYVGLVDWLIAGSPDALAPDGSKPNIAAHIAAGHSLFNVANTLVFLPFVHTLGRLVTWITPEPSHKEIPRLKFLPRGKRSPELAISAAEKEVLHMAELVKRSLEDTSRYVRAKEPKATDLQSIQKAEEVSDALQAEITRFLCQSMTAKLSAEQAERTQALIGAADDLESIADYSVAMCRHRDRLDDLNERFSPAARKDLRLFFTNVVGFFDALEVQMRSNQPWALESIRSMSKKIENYATGIQRIHTERLASGKCEPGAAICFNDMVTSLNKVQRHLMGVAECLGNDPAAA